MRKNKLLYILFMSDITIIIATNIGLLLTILNKCTQSGISFKEIIISIISYIVFLIASCILSYIITKESMKTKYNRGS